MKRWFVVTSVMGFLALASASGQVPSGVWPKEMEGIKLRFIRLDHGGAGWDDGMDAKTGADTNLLQAFADATPFKRVASKGESHPMRLLKKYPRDGRPPFVFLTGNGSMGRVSSSDAKILREYCLRGGLLIADAGSPQFHRSFAHFMRQVFPDKPLLDIADDDSLYQVPYRFPRGAPAFWHHGGRRALGIKHEGRWCVFYHPGDMNDAWKSEGYIDVRPAMRQAALQLGINLIYHAFKNYWTPHEDQADRVSSGPDAEPSAPQRAEAPRPEVVPPAKVEEVEDAETIAWKALSNVANSLQKSGSELRRKADLLRDGGDETPQTDVSHMDVLADSLFMKAALQYAALLARWPDHEHAGMVALRVGQNYMRAKEFQKARDAFQSIIGNGEYAEDVRAQAMYWRALARERMSGDGTQEAFDEYTRILLAFPLSKWAKYARGRLADPVFVKLGAAQDEF